MPTTTINLTQSNFRIYLSTPNRELDDIFWASVTALGERSEPIRTTNGIKKYFISTKSEVQPITLSKSANPVEDPIIVRWYKSFCTNEPLIEGSSNNGAVLFVVPLRPCAADELYDVSGKAYNLIPTSWEGWGADILNVTDTSTFTLELLATEVDISV